MSSSASWDALHPALKQLGRSPLFALHLDLLTPVQIGAIGSVTRRIVPVKGGVFGGVSGLEGTVLPGGDDWVSVGEDGTVRLDARIALRTTNGATIAMRYHGVRAGSEDVMATLASDVEVDPGAYYFRISAVFETAEPALAHLNRIVAVGTGQRRPDGVSYALYQID